MQDTKKEKKKPTTNPKPKKAMKKESPSGFQFKNYPDVSAAHGFLCKTSLGSLLGLVLFPALRMGSGDAANKAPFRQEALSCAAGGAVSGIQPVGLPACLQRL